MSAPEDKKVAKERTFGREIELDLTSREKEFELMMYPVSMTFKWDDWQKQFIEYSMKKLGV
jgi:hypothetical protein